MLEVLIAVIILAIVTIPFLHAFVTGAQTNSKSKMQLRATNAAENVMEDIKNLSFDEVLVKYNTSGATEAKDVAKNYINPADTSTTEPYGYEFDITNLTDASGDPIYKEKLPSGYKMKVTLDPYYYSEHNSLNLSSFDALDSETAAIYCMPTEYDEKIYAEYELANKNYESKAAEWVALEKNSTGVKPSFEARLRREIKVDIKKQEDYTDENGEVIPIVKVELSVIYCLDDDDIVPDDYSEQRVVTTKTLFDNSVSKKKLQAIYVMYNPRYKATSNPSLAKRDIADNIYVVNADNVEADLYVVAQNVNNHWSQWQDYLKKDKGLNLCIFEGDRNDVNDDDDYESPLHLRTNLCEEPDYMYDKDTSAPKKILMSVGVSKPSAMYDIKKNKDYAHCKGKFDPELVKTLDAADVAGKKLDSSTVSEMIYSVKVEVYQEGVKQEVYNDASDKTSGIKVINNGKVTLVTLTGTKLYK